MQRTLKGAAVAALVGYLGLCALLFFSQRSLIYYPQPREHGGADSVYTLAVDDAQLQISTRPRDGRKALIYFGGNAEDVSVFLQSFAEAFPDHAIYLLHYRGFGGSSGTPSEEALHADARALFDQVHAIHPEITIVGRSLGSGVAVRLASEKPIERLVLVTPYDSLEEIASGQYPYIPISVLLVDKFESFRYAPNITAPTLILLAERDDIIPHASTEKLYGRFAPGIARMETLPQTNHVNIAASPRYFPLLAGRVK